MRGFDNRTAPSQFDHVVVLRDLFEQALRFNLKQPFPRLQIIQPGMPR